jgi:hypothetical protein
MNVSDPGTNTVYGCVFPNCWPQVPGCKTLGSGNMPSAVAVDQFRYVYVADSMNERILVFNESCSVTKILSDPGYYPSGVAVALDGTVAATNLCSAPSCGAGNIVFFAPGSTTVTSTATGLMTSYFFGDFDKHGNFYNDGQTPSGGAVVGVVKKGTTTDVGTGISGIQYPGGIQVARNGTINVDDQLCACIQIYSGSSHVGTVTLSGAVDPVTFAFDARDAHIWVADAQTGSVNKYRYPAGKGILASLTGFTTPVGVGVVPADKP